MKQNKSSRTLKWYCIPAPAVLVDGDMDALGNPVSRQANLHVHDALHHQRHKEQKNIKTTSRKETQGNEHSTGWRPTLPIHIHIQGSSIMSDSNAVHTCTCGLRGYCCTVCPIGDARYGTWTARQHIITSSFHAQPPYLLISFSP